VTRDFIQTAKCPNCGTHVPAETPIRHWIRTCPKLDSSSKGAAIVCFDSDILVHKYLTHTDKKGTRDVQALMFIEAKSHANHEVRMSDSQRDTLGILNQLLRNRRRNIYKSLRRRQVTYCPNKVYSSLNKKNVWLRGFGGHLLELSNNDPDDSNWMRWDGMHLITQSELIKLLRFETDPDTMRPISWRRHHKEKPMPLLPYPNIF